VNKEKQHTLKLMTNRKQMNNKQRMNRE